MALERLTVMQHTGSWMMTIEATDLKCLQVLLQVHRDGGFAAAARELGLTRAAVSRSIVKLERRLGLRLARRTTRKVVLSDAAIALVERCTSPLDALGAALDAAREKEGGASGSVRLAGSAAFGRDVLVPIALAFHRENPAVRVDLTLSDHLDDLVARPIDVTVRVGPLPETSLVARFVGTLPLVVVGSRRLLGKTAPRSVDDLLRLPAIGFRVPATGRAWPWPFTVEGRHHLVEPTRRVFESDSIDAVVALVRAGEGVAVVPRHVVEADLRARRLVELLPREAGAGPAVHVCYGARELMPKRVRALVETLVRELPRACVKGPRLRASTTAQ